MTRFEDIMSKMKESECEETDYLEISPNIKWNIMREIRKTEPVKDFVPSWLLKFVCGQAIIGVLLLVLSLYCFESDNAYDAGSLNNQFSMAYWIE